MRPCAKGRIQPMLTGKDSRANTPPQGPGQIHGQRSVVLREESDWLIGKVLH